MPLDDTPKEPPAAGGHGGGTGALIDGLANAVRSLHKAQSRGDLANLRRMDSERPTEPAFQRILVRVAPDAGLLRAKQIALFVKILALGMSEDVLADGKKKLGAVMRAADVSERRVLGLMTAQGPTFDDLLFRLCRRLVREGSLPFVEIGRLILGRADTIETTRFSIARAFWTADAKLKTPPSTQTAAAGEPQ